LNYAKIKYMNRKGERWMINLEMGKYFLKTPNPVVDFRPKFKVMFGNGERTEGGKSVGPFNPLSL